MKTSGSLKKVFFLSVLLLIPIFLLAQSPKLVSYQAVVRDGGSQPMVNTAVEISITVNQGSAAGTQVYSETHSATTSAFGLVNVLLGNGSTPDDFSAIDWSNSPYYLNINVNGNDMDPVQLVSVPYAIYADEAGNIFSGNYNDLSNLPTLNISNWNTAYGWGDHATQGYLDSKWMLNGSTIYNPEFSNVSIGSDQATTGMLTVTSDPLAVSTDPAFQVINQDGFVVFEVLNNGSVTINIDESSVKGPKGGFAIGGFDKTKGLKQPYLSIDPDSTRLYFNETTTKGPKGGFAIGGFNTSKGSIDKYVEVRGDRSGAGNNVFLGQYAGGKDGYTSTSNVAIGNNAGLNLGPGSYNNVLIGQEAGMNSINYQNVFLGSGAGRNNIAGYNNICIGYESGSESHGQYNVFIGDEAGRYSDQTYANVAIGDEAGKNLGYQGSQNTLIGAQAGLNLGTGTGNVIIGTSAGSATSDADNNIFIGKSAGRGNDTGVQNVYIGNEAGLMTNGDNNVFIGRVQGMATGSNNVLIGNSPSTLGEELENTLIIDNQFGWPLNTSFIHGNMTSQEFRINAATGIKTAPEAGIDLNVAGDIRAANVTTKSDLRLKENIITIPDPLLKVMMLRGVNFDWNEEGVNYGKRSMGFIAQEAIEVIPELVTKGSDFYSINYAPVTALLVEAFKELKKENDELKSELSRLDDLEQQVRELKEVLNK